MGVDEPDGARLFIVKKTIVFDMDVVRRLFGHTPPWGHQVCVVQMMKYWPDEMVKLEEPLADWIGARLDVDRIRLCDPQQTDVFSYAHEAIECAKRRLATGPLWHISLPLEYVGGIFAGMILLPDSTIWSVVTITEYNVSTKRKGDIGDAEEVPQDPEVKVETNLIDDRIDLSDFSLQALLRRGVACIPLSPLREQCRIELYIPIFIVILYVISAGYYCRGIAGVVFDVTARVRGVVPASWLA